MFSRNSTWLAVALILWVLPSVAAERAALVIGNSTYVHTSPLFNPQKDAADISNALERLGFEVTRADNLKFDGLRRALRSMDRKAQGAEMAVIYYAGHGIELDKINYMIPVDAQLESDRAVSYEAVPLDLALNAVNGASKLKLVIADACRDNPFLKNMKKTARLIAASVPQASKALTATYQPQRSLVRCASRSNLLGQWILPGRAA